MWVDFHNHCLPEMDDGSRSAEMSERMLRMLTEQGVATVVATPHYIAHRESTEVFLQRRAQAYQRLRQRCAGDGFPEVFLGAEVRLERDISNISLQPLCMEGTNWIMLELPGMPFKSWMAEEIRNVAYGLKAVPILAHIDRYFTYYTKSDYEQLLSIEEAVLQVNVESLADRKIRKFVEKLVKAGYAVVFGSDAHDDARYRPNFDIAADVVRKSKVLAGGRFDEGAVDRLTRLSKPAAAPEKQPQATI